MRETCRNESCINAAVERGFCKRHVQRVRIHGDDTTVLTGDPKRDPGEYVRRSVPRKDRTGDPVLATQRALEEIAAGCIGCGLAWSTHYQRGRFIGCRKPA